MAASWSALLSRSWLFISLFAATATPALAIEPQPAPLVLGPGVETQLAPFASSEDFAGIIALNGCSGALVRFTSSTSGDRALALTNGHCYETGPLHAGQVLVDRPAYREFKLLEPDGSRTLALLKVDRLLYATMTGTDVALYRLALTYDEIATRYGVQPLTIATQTAPVGSTIRLVSGLWKKVYTCQIERYVPELREGEWTFTNALRYSADGCDIIPGTSGSPLINPETGEIVGINNTRNRSGESCTANNPCEVDAAGETHVLAGRGYGEQLVDFYSCLGPDNTLDLNQINCSLAKGLTAE